MADFFDGIDSIIGGIQREVPEILQAYVVWFAVQAVLDALFPPIAILIDVGFLVLTIVGLWQEVEEVFGASTVKVFILAVFNIAMNLWLISVIH